ncbi:MAG: amidohydrolase family protein [Acidobacteriales bacterium]|nr:amidohydrolase family protein [Terriglobales bacterium]
MTDSYTHIDLTAKDPLGDLRSKMAAGGILRAFVVETLKGDNREHLLAFLKERDPRFRLAFCYRPESPGAAKQFMTDPWVAALRINTAQLEEDTAWLAGLEASGKYLLIHAESGIARLVRNARAAVAAHPRLRIYVPHLGWPRNEGKDDPAWRDSVRALHAIPTAIIGISSLLTFSRQPFPHPDVHPFAQELIRLFGPERLVAGSDFPFIEKARYGEYVAVAHRWIRDIWPQWVDYAGVFGKKPPVP